MSKYIKYSKYKKRLETFYSVPIDPSSVIDKPKRDLRLKRYFNYKEKRSKRLLREIKEGE